MKHHYILQMLHISLYIDISCLQSLLMQVTRRRVLPFMFLEIVEFRHNQLRTTINARAANATDNLHDIIDNLSRGSSKPCGPNLIPTLCNIDLQADAALLLLTKC